MKGCAVRRVYPTLYWMLGIFIVIMDQVTKWWALQMGHAYYCRWGIEFIPTMNTGLAWSMFQTNLPIVHILLMFVVLSIIIGLLWHTAERHAQRLPVWPEVLIIAGGFSNLIDRFVRGGVVDFITLSDIPHVMMPTFNIADCWVVIGAFFLLIRELDRL
jgi:signal peptidase II